jgi:hypothetical protein
LSGIVKACLLLGGLFALAALAWMAFLPAMVEGELHAATGFDVRITVLSANPFTGRVVVRGLAARNPPAYPSPDFVILRELRADVDVFSWAFTDRIVINELDVDAAKIEIVRKRDGKTNAGEFAAAFSGSGATAPDGPGAVAQRNHTKCLIKRLRIRLDQLVIADYSGQKPDETAYSLNIDHTYSNVSSAKQLLVPEVVRSLYSFGLRHDAAQLLPGEFGRALADAVGSAAHIGTKLKDAGQKAQEYLKGLLDKLEQSAKP